MMPTNMILLFETSEEKQKRLFDSMKAKVSEIVLAVKSCEFRKVETGSLSHRILRTGIVYRVVSPFFKQMDHLFRTDQRCTGCGLCSRVCPAHNIEMRNGKPKWKHHCEMCLSCLNLCPNQALQCGKMTEGKRRYKNLLLFQHFLRHINFVQVTWIEHLPVINMWYMAVSIILAIAIILKIILTKW